jgi:hypothetical protein
MNTSLAMRARSSVPRAWRICLLLLLLAASAAAAAPSAQAKKPTPDEPVQVGAQVVVAPHAIPTPDGTGGAASIEGIDSVQGCGPYSCYLRCYGATTRNGEDGWSGHAYIYHDLSWCGWGAGGTIQWAGASQRYDFWGWFSFNYGQGPWWSGGCTESCGSIRDSGYLVTTWTSPWLAHTDTIYLHDTMYADGAITVSG